MNPAATLHRYVHLLRRLQDPYSYPSKEKIIAELQDKGFPTSSRTFERDIQALKQEYGILITYHRQKKGYFWELPEDEDISHFNTFVRLLEHKERLDILSNSAGNWFKTARYLLLEHNDRFKGMDHLSQLWDALQTQRVINFLYQSYDKTAHKQ